ncbi:unnamed protein product [Citrullus colocynthis]|uniref:Uncharacterized protein n=1 Tax=Citrullus colocynthis TaxID=252529 RepID=A0ABP0Z9U7_9ROSI
MIGGAIGDLEEINVDGRNTTSPKLRRYGALFIMKNFKIFVTVVAFWVTRQMESMLIKTGNQEMTGTREEMESEIEQQADPNELKPLQKMPPGFIRRVRMLNENLKEAEENGWLSEGEEEVK